MGTAAPKQPLLALAALPRSRVCLATRWKLSRKVVIKPAPACLILPCGKVALLLRSWMRWSKRCGPWTVLKMQRPSVLPSEVRYRMS
ncbi:hypothetical protein D3C76_1003270 [compost metagenome]